MLGLMLLLRWVMLLITTVSVTLAIAHNAVLTAHNAVLTEVDPAVKEEAPPECRNCPARAGFSAVCQSFTRLTQWGPARPPGAGHFATVAAAAAAAFSCFITAIAFPHTG